MKTLIRQIRLSLRVLSANPEWQLEFLYGQRLGEIPEKALPRKGRRGLFLKALVFWKKAFRTASFTQRNLGRTNILFYAGTMNQAQALKSTYQDLEKLEEGQAFLKHPRINDDSLTGMRGVYDIDVSALDTIAGLFVFLARLIPLHRELRRPSDSAGIARTSYIEKFLKAHLLVPYFVRVVDQIKPSLVIVSNDHSLGARSICAVGRHLGARTVYMQHASVTDRFPPLEFDYAFLDGVIAAERYANCEGAAVKSKDVQVFLTGQKKQVQREQAGNNKFCIGIAINSLDDPDHVLDFAESILALDINVRIRTHPAQNGSSLEKLKKFCKADRSRSLVGAGEESLSDFFSRCDVLVAGNSSILLESVIAGLPSYYKVFSDYAPWDYYGYIKEGLVKPFPDNISKDRIMRLAKIDGSIIQVAKRYSATIGTLWEGKEGKLVAETIRRFNHRSSPPNLYQSCHSQLGSLSIYCPTDKG